MVVVVAIDLQHTVERHYNNCTGLLVMDIYQGEPRTAMACRKMTKQWSRQKYPSQWEQTETLDGAQLLGNLVILITSVVWPSERRSSETARLEEDIRLYKKAEVVRSFVWLPRFPSKSPARRCSTYPKEPSSIERP